MLCTLRPLVGSLNHCLLYVLLMRPRADRAQTDVDILLQGSLPVLALLLALSLYKDLLHFAPLVHNLVSPPAIIAQLLLRAPIQIPLQFRLLAHGSVLQKAL